MGDRSGDDFMESWIDAINKGGMFARRSKSDQSLVERSTAQEFAKAYQALFGVEITNIDAGSDPPDVQATVGKRMIGLELVELLKRNVREQRARTGPPFQYAGQFEASQWSCAEFEQGVNALLDAKHTNYLKRPDLKAIDVLVVHTDEHWLEFKTVQDWLTKIEFQPRSTIVSAFLLMTYSPSYSNDHWPLLQLYGEIERPR